MRSSPAAPDRGFDQATPAVNGASRATRLAVAIAAVGLPLLHAALLAAGGRAWWPMLVAVAAGLVLRVVGASLPAVLLSLLLAPVWQVLAAATADGAAGFDQVLPWLAFLGAALAWPGPQPWQADRLWGGAIATWALVLATVTPVVVARELDFTWQAAAWPNLTSVVLVGALAQLTGLLLFDWYWGASERERSLAWRALIPGTVVAALVAVWQQQVDPALLSSPLWSGLQRSAGTFFDANATAAFLALTVPVLMSARTRPQGVPAAAWAVCGLAIGLAGIVATGSRSALVALAVVVALQFFAGGGVWRGVATAAALAVGGWLVLAGAPVADPSSGHALGRLGDTLRQVMARDAEGVWVFAWDRDGYGPTAMRMIADHPWTGIGPGLFGTMVPGYAVEALGWPLPPDNAQNWWRHQVAELGLAGALPALACSLLALGAALQRRHWPAAAPLAGIGLLAVMSPPTPHPLLQVLAGLLIAHAVASPRPAGEAALTGRDPLATWGLALGCAAMTLVTGHQELRPPYRAARFRTLYNYGVTAMQSTPYGDGRWMTTRAVAVLLPVDATLVARVVVPHDDAATRPVQVTVSTRDGVACRHNAVDATPFECRMAVSRRDFAMVQIDISRAWREQDGMAQAAFVSARFEP